MVFNTKEITFVFLNFDNEQARFKKIFERTQ